MISARTLAVPLAMGGALAASGCDRVLGLHPVTASPDATTIYRRTITITPRITNPVDDAAIHVALAADPGLAAHAAPGGTDLVFTQGDTPLDAEIVRLDPDGTLDAWVRLPELTPAGAQLELSYGGPPRTSNPIATWPGALYAAVWHLSDSDDHARDSTMHRHDLVSTAGMMAPAPGVAGLARAYPGANAASDCASDVDGSLEQATGSFAYSAWVNQTAEVDGADMPLYKGGASNAYAGYDLELGSGQWAASIADMASANPAPVFASTPLHGWHQLAVVVDRGAGMAFGYVDAALVDNEPLAGLGSVSGPEPMCLGGDGDRGNPFHGSVDEVRIYRAAITADRIAAEYDNLTAPSFLTIGPET